MPYNRPGPGVYVVNGEEPLNHGSPCVVDNFVGVAVKQRTRGWGDAFAVAAIIDPGEPFFIITKGVVQVSDEGLNGAAKGDEVWVSEDGTLGTSGDAKFGRIVEVAGERGTPLNRVRVDLDAKDSF
ncbi:MAG: hypothetical protein J2P39_08855 [Candidatus Dormibacteraeota bacterium]|nr:hypothetical protein [Candidatus Dormibacteraeota bacterium]